jgi:hypothetical protein
MVIDDNEKTVTCRICGENSSRIYGKHLKFKHNMKSEEYKKLFPGAPLSSKSDLKNTTKNSGKHMKEEKYKKMFSEMFSGENNPNHKSKTTEEERKSRSPFSKKFIKYENLENLENHISNFVKKALKNRIGSTTIEYFIQKGLSEDDAIKKLKERQTTFSLEKCIEKYGNELGRLRWLERQEKWQKNLLENGNMKCGFSKISQELFNEILKNMNQNDYQHIYYATKNKEYFISIKGFGFFSYDYVDIYKRKIIEYNGDDYHANPIKYEAKDYPHPFYKENGPTAEDIWKKDKLKREIAESKGFELLTVWDSEYRKDKKITISKCLNFLNY